MRYLIVLELLGKYIRQEKEQNDKTRSKTEPETIYLPFKLETTERRVRTSESESEDITIIKYVLVRAF